jgi:hypothetical protein
MSEIQSYMAARPAAVVAQTFLKRWSTASSPFLVTADDGNRYVVKSNVAHRQIVNDQIVARLGESLGAATGVPALVKVEQAFIDLSPEVKNVGVVPGTWHGLSYVENYSEREGFQHFGLPENRERFALLAILYGWALSQDHQIIYSNAAPPLVLSVDHGHFFPSGPDWTIASLQAMTAVAAPDSVIRNGAQVADDAINAAKVPLRNIDAVTVIARAVAMPLDEWQINIQERVAMAEYLERRRAELLA